ncbi:hypothetical protein A0J57_18215 [Sphingobium sp. 22B]|uniref:hypothetical protein n=1 Tax=unclassified Sphingobium TaxID=2611147 RepID=UPI0007840501|nr:MULTISPECIES: hypothetical protein [unclassified Sphingobium]KXU29221.1 hypothetical protein AXW74_24215 [Sphingobium sp. AM]KYC30927.1 hypothetical protein A0J57_18215 [Sphingobium sp. 22B]OAP30459.1 hypothetical protein A8O16_18505 [Sphingobium sp. 20006FA]
MPFEPLPQTPRVPTNWDLITHIKLVKGMKPDTGLATKRWEELRRVADDDGVISLLRAFAVLDPVRPKGNQREASIRKDLRNWSNPRDHGNNSQDKGWLELGRLT